MTAVSVLQGRYCCCGCVEQVLTLAVVRDGGAMVCDLMLW